MTRRLAFPFIVALLSSCGAGRSSVSSISSESTVEQTSDSSSLESSSSSFSSSYVPTPGDGAWTLDYKAIPATSQSSYNVNFDFSVTTVAGRTVKFHGDYLQRGSGSKGGVSLDGTIQMKKEVSYFQMEEGYASHVEFRVLRIVSEYSGEVHDYTGIPSVYAVSDAGKGAEITLEKKEFDEYINYSFDLLNGVFRFRFENASGNALYLVYLHNFA